MTPENALKTFLSKVLSHKKERLIGFISRPKTQQKFLNTIHHELESCLDSSMRVDSLPVKALQSKCYVFEPLNTFGKPFNSLQEAVETLQESFLAISIDGKYAVFGPETYIDSRTYYAAK